MEVLALKKWHLYSFEYLLSESPYPLLELSPWAPFLVPFFPLITFDGVITAVNVAEKVHITEYIITKKNLKKGFYSTWNE